MTFLILFYLVLIAAWVLKTKTSLKPWMAESNIHWFPLSLSIVAGLVGGNTFVTFTGFSYKYGSVALIYFLGVFLGLLVFHIFNKRIRGMSQESIGAGLVYDNYPSSTQVIFTVANLFRFLSVSLIQVIAGSILLSQISGISYNICSIIIVISIIAYTYRHGFSGVIKTDIVQMILLILPLLAISLYFVLNQDILNQTNHTNIVYQNFSISKGVLFGLFGFLLVIGSLDIWQRYTRIISDSDSMRSLTVSIICLTISGIGIFAISILVHFNFPGYLDANTVFVKVFTENALPKLLNIPLTIAILSAILSTADTFIHGSAILLVKTINGNNNKAQNDANFYKKILPVIGLTLILVANFYSDILSIAIFFANLVFAFSPFLLLLTLGLKPNYKMVNIGLVASSMFAMFVGVIPNIQLEYSYGTLFLSVLFMTLGLVIKEDKEDKQYIEE